MKFYGVLFFLILFSLASFASLSPKLPYQSGEKFCRQNSHTNGFRVQVPVSYTNPTLGFTSIFAWTVQRFDPTKPSLIIFWGGPGGSAHDSDGDYAQFENWNVILFDQRGVACSRPEAPALIEDSEYYRSEWIARDANEILNHLTIAKATAWGHSYGTVPATQFGSLFQNKTQALILEGVILNGDQRLWQPPHRLKLIQRFFQKFPADVRDRILRISSHPEADPYWFSGMLRYMMYARHWEDLALKFINYFLEQDDASLIQSSHLYGKATEFLSSAEDSEESGSFTFLYISCREFGGGQDFANRLAGFENGKLVPAKFSGIKDECLKRNIPSHPYRAADFSVKVPVYYFNGTTDGATEAPAAIQHYKQVAKGPAQLFLVRESGHVPLTDLLQEKQFFPLFDKILKGDRLSRQDIINFNKASEIKLSFTEKP